MSALNGKPIVVAEFDDDHVFIRLSDQPEYFLHADPANPANGYQAMQGYIGAAFWHKANADRLIKHSGIPNIETVPVKSIISETGPVGSFKSL